MILKTIVEALEKMPDQFQPSTNESAPWLAQGLSVLGMNEIVNGKVNPLVTEMFSFTSYKTQKNEPWCAAFICWCLAKTGYANPATAAAVGFSKYGVACDYKKGAIIVMRHPSGGHHVTFFDSWINENDKMAKCYGGNQGNQAKYSTYDFKSETILGVRWPVVARESTR
jgi:uncharacterized protein (TIGR02594 family)